MCVTVITVYYDELQILYDRRPAHNNLLNSSLCAVTLLFLAGFFLVKKLILKIIFDVYECHSSSHCRIAGLESMHLNAATNGIYIII